MAPNKHQPQSRSQAGGRAIRRGEGGGEWMGGPLWSPVAGGRSMTQGQTGVGERATIKAHPTTLQPPSPLRRNQRHFVRLMPIGDPLWSPSEVYPYILCI